MARTLIIAEGGVNHNGDIALALELVDRAAEAGADIIKFQTFDAARLASSSAPKASYQKRQTGADGGQRAMLERLQLCPTDHAKLIARCKDRQIEFLSSPFDVISLDLLVGRFGLKRLKLGSGELTNAPLLLDAARSGADIVLSTGMATLSEIEEALGVLAFGGMSEGSPCSRSDFAASLLDPKAWTWLRSKVTLMHCTTEYPAAVSDTNLRAMATMKAAFGLPVGYSDHTEGSAISLAAIALGAVALEKHFTLDRTLAGPDHAASLEPEELVGLVRDVRAVEMALGSGIKQPGTAELANRTVARKSVHAQASMETGHIIEAADLTTMRPGDGRSPMDLWDLVGSTVNRRISSGEKFN